MDLLNYLGALGNQPGDFSDPSMQIAGMQGQQAPQAPQAPQAAMPQVPHHSTFANILGMLGDALLAAHGRPAIYGPRVAQEKLGATLAASLGNSDPNMMALAQQDPGTFLQIWQAQHKKDDLPAGLQEFQAYRDMPSDQKPTYERFLQLTHPGMTTPVIMEPGDHLLGGSSGPPAAAVAHLQSHPELAGAFDQKYGSGAAARALGGATASTPSSNFPAR